MKIKKKYLHLRSVYIHICLLFKAEFPLTFSYSMTFKKAFINNFPTTKFESPFLKIAHKIVL